MGFKAITKNTPAEEPPHILSEDDAAIYRGILGQDGVLNIGSKLKPTVISNNKVRVGDGVINVDGHIGRNAYADYEDLTIENGSAGKKRHDLIVASFSTTGSGGLDTYILKVIKGVTGDTGADPAVTKQDIYAGGKLREYPLYRVKLDGLSIVAVEQMFKVIPTVPELETKYNELNSTLSKKSNTDHLHDERYYTESEIDKKINSINSKFSSELTQGTSGSPRNQGVFKGQSGIMIIWGAHPTTAFTYDSGANYYYADISFRTEFKENPIVAATPRFSGGIPENVGTLSVTPSKLRLGCNVQVSGLYIEWIAVGKWK